MKARELIRTLQANGWFQVRQTGSHRIFRHSARPDTLVIPDHGSRDIPTGTLRSILKQAGISYLLMLFLQ